MPLSTIAKGLYGCQLCQAFDNTESSRIKSLHFPKAHPGVVYDASLHLVQLPPNVRWLPSALKLQHRSTALRVDEPVEAVYPHSIPALSPQRPGAISRNSSKNTTMDLKRKPQAAVSSFGPRMQHYPNPLLQPVIPSITGQSNVRTGKRTTNAHNYAEDINGDDEDEDYDAPKRMGSTRKGRDDMNAIASVRDTYMDRLGKTQVEPINDTLPVERTWMVPAAITRTDIQLQAPAELPDMPVPIRLDIDISSFVPDSPSILWQNYRELGIDATRTEYRKGDPTPAYRLKDTLTWNLYEAYLTPEAFALDLVRDLNIPLGHAAGLITQIGAQILQQLQMWAPIAHHPTFNQTYDEFDVDESYKCCIELNLLLGDEQFTDRFEWNLLHPAGKAEELARMTSDDFGKSREWSVVIGHGINEAVMEQRKAFLESGIVPEYNSMAHGSGAIRYDPEGLGQDWGPTFKKLSREELEKREGDRERERRRQRRERAAPPMPSYFDQPEASETPMGRGARNKKQRRFLSPGGRDGTPGGGTPDVSQQPACGIPNDIEKQSWRCQCCKVHGGSVWGVAEGPTGGRTLCHCCGFLWFQNSRVLPPSMMNLHANDPHPSQIIASSRR